MKVICIDDKWEGISNKPQPPLHPVFGEIVTVTSCTKDEDGEFYTFLEYGEFNDYSTDGFAPLSKIDERKLLKERQKELV